MLQKIFLLTLDNCVNCHQLKNILQKAYPKYLKHIQIINRQQMLHSETFNQLVNKYNIKKAPALINDKTGTILRSEKLDMIDAFLKENISLPNEEL
ncbi:MAG: hypothetical protein ACQKHC_03390 [Candidatus Phytoplasma pruni]|uniref:hypothetical protein n=1 Tax=Milkweed yellows phytoplasma TaxID=208434 RepID=UPI000363971E|nr:hypothetical protein [Milkweed yellows phytoplasma]